MTYNAKNYTEQGGEVTVIKGELNIDGGKITKEGTQAAAITKPTGGTTEDAEARAAIDDIIDALIGAGIIAGE